MAVLLMRTPAGGTIFRSYVSLARHFSVQAGQARNSAVTDATSIMERYARDIPAGEA